MGIPGALITAPASAHCPAFGGTVPSHKPSCHVALGNDHQVVVSGDDDLGYLEDVGKRLAGFSRVGRALEYPAVLEVIAAQNGVAGDASARCATCVTGLQRCDLEASASG